MPKSKKLSKKLTGAGPPTSGLSMLGGAYGVELKAKQLAAVIRVLKKEFGDSAAKTVLMESVRVNI